VSNLGNVRSWKTRLHTPTRAAEPKLLKLSPNGDGYPTVVLQDQHRSRRRNSFKVHVLVAASFIGPRPDGLEVCHNNGVTTDNALSNLRYDTKSGNQQDRVAHGTHARGERSPRAILTQHDVEEIRRRYKGKGLGPTQRELAREFGVGDSTVGHVIGGGLWGWLVC
jgi:hypothetical protein